MQSNHIPFIFTRNFSLLMIVFCSISPSLSLSLSLSLSQIFDSHLTGTKIFDSQRFARKIAIIYPLFGILFDIIERKRREEYLYIFFNEFQNMELFNSLGAPCYPLT